MAFWIVLWFLGVMIIPYGAVLGAHVWSELERQALAAQASGAGAGAALRGPRRTQALATASDSGFLGEGAAPRGFKLDPIEGSGPHPMRRRARSFDELARDISMGAGLAPLRDYLARGGNANAAGVLGDTLLHLTADTGQIDEMRALVRAGAAIDARNESAETPLMRAACRGHAEAIEVLLPLFTFGVDDVDLLGRTPLIMAAEAGKASAVSALLDRDADASARDHSGRTALEHAKRLGPAGAACVELLSRHPGA